MPAAGSGYAAAAASSAGRASPAGTLPADPDAILAAGAAASAAVVRLLDQCVREGLEGTGSEALLEGSGGGSGTSPSDSFVDALIGEREFPDSHAARVMQRVGERAGDLAEACAGAPRAFLQLCSLVNALLAGLPSSSATWAAASDAMVRAGAALVRLDARGAQSLFRDLQLPGLLPVLRTQATKRVGVLRVLYAFTPRDTKSRKAAVGTLRDALKDQRAFLHCVSVLSFLEPDMDRDLAEAYLYYAGIGGTSSSPQLRAAAVGIIAAVIPADPRAAAQRLSSLRALASDASWWEVRVQVALAAGQLLAVVPPAATEGDDAMRGCMEVVQDMLVRVLEADAGPIVGRAAVAFAADALHNYPESIVPAFVRAVLALDEQDRVAALEAETEPRSLPLTGASGAVFTLPPAAATWPAVTVARELARAGEDPSLSLSPAHLQLLVALLRPEEQQRHDGLGGEGEGERKDGEGGESGDGGGERDPEWAIPPELEKACFEPLLDHVLEGMTRAETIGLAAEAVRLVAVYGSGPAVLGALQDAVELLVDDSGAPA